MTDAERAFTMLTDDEKEARAARLLHEVLTKQRKASYDYDKQLTDLVCTSPYGDNITAIDKSNDVGILPQEGWQEKRSQPQGNFMPRTGASRSQLQSKAGEPTVKIEQVMSRTNSA